MPVALFTMPFKPSVFLWIQVCVLSVVFVTMRAVCLPEIVRSVYLGDKSSKYIFLAGDNFQMLRINAFRIPAQVVNVHLGSYWAYVNFVGYAMRKKRLLPTLASAQLPIPVTSDGSGPNPATFSLFEFLFKSFKYGFCHIEGYILVMSKTMVLSCQKVGVS